MTSRGRLLLSWIEAAVPGEGATRIIRRDIQGDTERGYAERGRQHQQFPLVEIEHRVSQPLIGTSRGGPIVEIDIAATAQTEYRPVHESGAERHAPRGLANKMPCTAAAARQCVEYGAAIADHAGQYCSFCKNTARWPSL
jgi:hypothetical protein